MICFLGFHINTNIILSDFLSSVCLELISIICIHELNFKVSCIDQLQHLLECHGYIHIIISYSFFFDQVKNPKNHNHVKKFKNHNHVKKSKSCQKFKKSKSCQKFKKSKSCQKPTLQTLPANLSLDLTAPSVVNS